MTQIHHTDDESYADIGTPVRITNNGTSLSVTVPVNANAFVCFAESGDCRLELDGAATANSTIFCSENSMIIYPINGNIQTLYCYGNSGTYGNFRFLALM